MANYDINMTLERYAQDYANDPEFIAEGLSIRIIEEMLQYLAQNNLSQSWLAQKTKVSRAHISRMFNAPPNMTLLTIAKFAVALGVTPDVCLNAESRRLSATVPTTDGDIMWVWCNENDLQKTERPVESSQQYRQWAAEATGSFPPRVPQETTA